MDGLDSGWESRDYSEAVSSPHLLQGMGCVRDRQILEGLISWRLDSNEMDM